MLGPAASGLEVRRRQAELMDDPALDERRHVEALRALGRINRVSLTGERIWSEVRAVHARTGRSVRVFDVACGGGDVLAAVGRRAERSGVPVELAGCDVSPVALDRARSVLGDTVRPDGTPPRLLELDVLADDLPSGYDLVVCSLFLHHLDADDAVALLRRMRTACRESLLVQDLLRTRLGYGLAWLGLHVLTRSPVARVDGLRSVRASFSLDEARAMADAAALSGARVERAWPERFVISWRHA